MLHQTNKVAQALIKEAISLYRNNQISLKTCQYLVGIAYSLKIYGLLAQALKKYRNEKMNKLAQLKLVQKHLSLAIDHLIQAGTDMDIYLDSKKDKTYSDDSLLSDNLCNSVHSLECHQKLLDKLIEAASKEKN